MIWLCVWLYAWGLLSTALWLTDMTEKHPLLAGLVTVFWPVSVPLIGLFVLILMIFNP